MHAHGFKIDNHAPLLCCCQNILLGQILAVYVVLHKYYMVQILQVYNANFCLF